MKLCRLKLKNLNSFRKEIDIDFEKSPLDGASLVAITGPTGAGKTTLLDAICISLYGKTPRLSGTGSQHPRHLISHGEKEGFAEVHFMANGTPYVAVWSLRRGSSAQVRLAYAVDNKLISDKLTSKGKALGSSQRTVSEEVESILGLDFDAFRRSVMLAQGEFAAFLKASKEERRAILEATAGIHIYEVLRQVLLDKVREVEAANADVQHKLSKIPEASQKQLAEAEEELDWLKERSQILGMESQQVQQERSKETKRKEDYENLQFLEKRQKELADQQPKIEALQSECENAERAERLRAEKREFDNAKLERQKAEEAFDVATTEKMGAEELVRTDQADFDEKEKTYQAASTEYKQKADVYTAAKLDVRRAADQFAEADKRTAALADVDDKIGTLSEQLTSNEAEQTELEKQIEDTKIFLNENPLPSDRQHRLNRANGLLSQLGSQQKQLKDRSTSQKDYAKQVLALKGKLEELAGVRQERLSKKAAAETTLETATAALNKLLTIGTREEWTARKQQVVEAQPIAQKYETVENDLLDSEAYLQELNAEKAALDAELKQISEELEAQESVCQRAAEVVERCEEARKSAMLVNPINQLRQRLQPGEPCSVCGATQHPRAHVVEPEGEDLLRNAEEALEQAQTEQQIAQDERQAVKTQQAQTQRDKRRTADQIEAFESEIEKLRSEKAKCLVKWREIYLDDNVSSDGMTEQIGEADAAIATLGEATQARMEASHAYEMAAQQLETCENDIARETDSLTEAENQLSDLSDAVKDLQTGIATDEERFWDLLPKTFHGIVPDAAVDQFEEKIEVVAKSQDELGRTETKLKLLSAKIETGRSSLEDRQHDRDDVQVEVDRYQREGERLLDTVRGNTGGLETEAAINAAIEELEDRLQLKTTGRDEAAQQLQKSQTLLTEKRATHGHCKKQYEESSEKLETACDAYFDKLSDAGFASPEAHDNAFRSEAQIRELTDQIDVYEDEKQQLALDIAKLRARFEEVPFDPEALRQIETQAKEIGEQLQAAQQEVGAQQQRIDNLEDALEKRAALADEQDEAQGELERWQRLYEVMPRNDLRDFALEIMFKQMGTLANEQLKYLTSERYQLKVETIGDLSVIDRWNANEERPVETLSGGESFLTSLALALALADLSRGRAQLNSLFLDEGFGTLDAETLEIAIAALEGLRMQGRSIFLISHIQELTRRLPVKINVKKQGDKSSDNSFSSSIEIRG